MEITRVPPVAAAEAVTILATVGVLLLILGGIASYPQSVPVLWPVTGPLLILGGACLIAALVLHVTRSK